MRKQSILLVGGRASLSLALAAALITFGSSCANNDGPKPPRERISSLPQNLPAQWEGQSQMGGMPTSY